MAIYHLSATVVQRSKGHSAVAGAAYRAGEKLHETLTDLTHDYQRKRGIVQSGIIAPDNSPAWVYSREALWNRAELAEKRRDAQPAREIRLALPDELTDEQRADLVFTYARDMFVGSGMIADVSIHRPDRHGDQRNHHAHILLTMRELDGDRFAAKKQRDWNRSELLEKWREEWANYQNRALEDAGSDARIDHRSLEAQGINREPTRHLGKDATAIEREGKHSRIGDENREIEAHNRKLDTLVSEYAAIEAEIQRELEMEFLRGQTEQEEAPAYSWEAAIDAEGTLNWTLEMNGEQVQLTWEEQKRKAQDPFASEIALEFESQIREHGEMKEYGLGTNWFDRTVAKFENLYYDAAQAVKDTWEKYVASRFRDSDNDPDRGFELDR